MLYKQISWMPRAYHVFDDDTRIGVVTYQEVKTNGEAGLIWTAHNLNFFTLPGQYATRSEAAAAIPRGPVHQPVHAFSGH